MEKVTDWGVILVPARPNGRMRFVRVIGTDDWDDALSIAEAHNPGWDATQGGPFVKGNSMPLHDTITAKK